MIRLAVIFAVTWSTGFAFGYAATRLRVQYASLDDRSTRTARDFKDGR